MIRLNCIYKGRPLISPVDIQRSPVSQNFKSNFKSTNIKGLVIINTGLPLLTGCEIQGLFRNFSGPFQANSRIFFTKKALLFSILIQYGVLQDLLLGKIRGSVSVFIHCYIKGILSGCDKQLILIIICS